MNGYQMLAHAIVKQAVHDYRKAQRTLARRDDYKPALQTIDECERFFRSQWFTDLSGLDGEYIIRRLEQEVRKK